MPGPRWKTVVGVTRGPPKLTYIYNPPHICKNKVGVGVFVDSCRSCGNCKGGEEQYCTGDGTLGSAVFTYNFRLPNGELVHGGYSQAIVVDEGAS